MAYLVLVRHGQSKWNATGQWTGWTDIGLTAKGKAEARTAAKSLSGIKFDAVFSSCLWRAQETTHEILAQLGQPNTPIACSPDLNERDYGDLTGKNKWQVRDEYGEKQFDLWRRGWNVPIPGGETLKDVYERAVPYYVKNILPQLEDGKNILISAHGNSLRALVKYLDNISDEDVSNLEIGTGEVYVYDISAEGKIRSKEIKVTGQKA